MDHFETVGYLKCNLLEVKREVRSNPLEPPPPAYGPVVDVGEYRGKYVYTPKIAKTRLLGTIEN